MGKYYIVDGDILPEVLVKVVEARKLLRKGKVSRITSAAKAVGISRGTYYKYKDRIFAPGASLGNRKVVMSLKLKHQSGVLSKVLDCMSSVKANIITLNQNIPIHDVATVMISFEMTEMNVSLEAMIDKLKVMKGVNDVYLEAVE
ncbi:MAG: ACT domain-containing protein [Erysipelotrichaceae bacterium]|nr:ACT domain-containing protein [Erysipelotrichaceae bacterium]